MKEKQCNETYRHDDINEEHAIGLWTALGLDSTDDYTTAEMLEIVSKKINSGEISPEEMKAAIERVKSQRE
jgi:hypothetical protein